MIATYEKQAVMGRVSSPMPFREPRLVQRGTDRETEHGPGAVRTKFFESVTGAPVKAQEYAGTLKGCHREVIAKQGGNTDFPVLVRKAQGRFLF